MTFADLVANLDKAAAPILVVLDQMGPQWMTGPNDTVQVFARDNSALGFKVTTVSKADRTEVKIAAPPVAALNPAPAPVLAAAIS